MKTLKKFIGILTVFSLIGCSIPVFAAVKSDHPVTKNDIRSDFKLVITASKKKYPIASSELNNSLQDSPSKRDYSSTSTVAKKIKGTWEYENIIKSIKNNLKSTTKTKITGSGSTALKSDSDLYLAYHKMSYEYVATKSGGKWTIAVTLNDTYNFEKAAWDEYSATLGTAAVIINNYAVDAQRLGAIVPFEVAVTMPRSYCSL